MNRSLLAGVALAALSTTAFAADMPVYPVEAAVAPVVEASDWAGFYVGVQGGYSFGEAEYSNDVSIFGTTIPGEDGSYDVDGFNGGAYFGTNMQFGSWVIGADSSISYSDADGDSVTTDGFGTEIERDLKWFSTTRGRVGYSFDRFMVFAAGGVAIGESEVRIDTGFGGTSSDEEIHIGWTAGAGVEAKLGNNWSARVEYLYVDLGEEDYDLDIAPISIESNTSLDMHVVRGGIAYHF